MARQQDHQEIEAKLWVPELAPVAEALQVHGAALRHPRILERNIRYEDPDGTFVPGGIVLRLRQDSQVRLTYKSPAEAATADGLQARFEAEVVVDDFATMDLILRRLGYRPFMIYEKYRTTYALGEVEVVLDELPYGHFVEIEGPPAAIEMAVQLLGLAACHRFVESYARLFDYVRANLGLTFTDLTFANFAGIEVPFEAFLPPGG
ncbi:MAG: class IV adenylate cyclase [Anaerolineae bacterium]|nr:class IV adenylate cyclase [Anaerolineae bacterium]